MLHTAGHLPIKMRHFILFLFCIPCKIYKYIQRRHYSDHIFRVSCPDVFGYYSINVLYIIVTFHLKCAIIRKNTPILLIAVSLQKPQGFLAENRTLILEPGTGFTLGRRAIHEVGNTSLLTSLHHRHFATLHPQNLATPCPNANT